MPDQAWEASCAFAAAKDLTAGAATCTALSTSCSPALATVEIAFLAAVIGFGMSKPNGSAYTGHAVEASGEITWESRYRFGASCWVMYAEGTIAPLVSRTSEGANIATVCACGVAALTVRKPLVCASITVSAGVRTNMVTVRVLSGPEIRVTIRLPIAVFSASTSNPAPASGYTTCPASVT
ncbi:Uncharacterised protein [Mycobacteroides abscessus subsp. abscessus]|nr:Uncharacterised protein [Mycobacteroides abscessus subsp. abscessus]